MLTSILHPVVHGEHRSLRQMWLKLAALHSLGNLISAVAVGGTLATLALGISLIGLQPMRPAYWCGLFLTLLYLPRELGWLSFPPLIQSTRQVPRSWACDYPRWKTALLFGLGLGNGFYTRIVVPTFYLLIIWPFLTQNFLWSLLIWGSYGLARSLHVWWLAWTASVDDLFSSKSKLTQALMQRSDWMYRVNAGLLVLIAVWLMAWRNF